MALTPDNWLDRLASKMDLRSTRIANLRSYIDGDAPLPEGAEGCRDTYKDFQRKARTNFGELVVEAVVERMVVSGFTIEASEINDTAESKAKESDDDQCRMIWKRNRLQIGISDVLRDMIGVGSGYVIVGQDDNGKAVITCERPEQVITEQDAEYPIETIAALKVYRDFVNEYDVAFLHLPGYVYTYIRPFRNQPGSPEVRVYVVRGGWRLVEQNATGLDFVPVFPFFNRGGLGEFESHIDVLNRINWDILQRLVITAMQAFRQRAIKGDISSEDEQGKAVDYRDMFKPGAGNLWQLPEGVELWESQETDITAILEATKDDIRHLAAVTRTPMSTLIPDSANQSAEGASAAREGLVFKAAERVTRASAPLARVMEAALAIENGTSKIDGTVEILWLPVERQSLAERADAATKVSNIVPWRTVMTDFLQFPANRVDDMEAERTTDALMTSLALPLSAPATPAPVPVPNA